MHSIMIVLNLIGLSIVSALMVGTLLNVFKAYRQLKMSFLEVLVGTLKMFLVVFWIPLLLSIFYLYFTA